jgi:hypothetical protein
MTVEKVSDCIQLVANNWSFSLQNNPPRQDELGIVGAGTWATALWTSSVTKRPWGVGYRFEADIPVVGNLAV